MDPERWRRIEEIYHSALEMKPELRESYLDEACAGICRCARKSSVFWSASQRRRASLTLPLWSWRRKRWLPTVTPQPIPAWSDASCPLQSRGEDRRRGMAKFSWRGTRRSSVTSRSSSSRRKCRATQSRASVFCGRPGRPPLSITLTSVLSTRPMRSRVPFIVMEYVEGESLKERLARVR